MNLSLAVTDNFFPDPQSIRDFALEHDYSLGNEMDGHHYPGTAKPKHEFFTPWFETLLSAAVGAPVKTNLCAFVSGLAGTKTEQWIHADSNCAQWASVTYLFEGYPEHGTSFWTHAESGKHRMDQGFYDALKIDLEDPEQVQGLVDKIKAEGEDETKWLRGDTTAARFNRTIWFDSKAFHSRSQRLGFGKTVEEGRLIIVSFFDILQ